MTGAYINAPKSPAVPVPIRAEGGAAVFAIRRTPSPEMITLRYATLDATRPLGGHRGHGDGRSLAVRPIRPADLVHLPTWPEGSDANPEHEDNK